MGNDRTFFCFIKDKMDPWEIDRLLKKNIVNIKNKIFVFFSFSSESYFKNETPKTNEFFKNYIKKKFLMILK